MENRERGETRKRDHERECALLGPRGPGPTLITTPPDFLVIIWWFQYRDRISSGISTLTFHWDNHTHPPLPRVRCAYKALTRWNPDIFTYTLRNHVRY